MDAAFIGIVVAMLQAAFAVILGCNYYTSLNNSMIIEQSPPITTRKAPYYMMGIFLGHFVGLLSWNLLAASVVGVVILGAIWCKVLLPEVLNCWQNTSDVPFLVFGVAMPLIVALAGYFFMFGVGLIWKPSFELLAIGAACLAAMYTQWGKRLLLWL